MLTQFNLSIVTRFLYLVLFNFCAVGNGAVSTTENPTQLNTIQRVNCLGGSGTFTLAFRGETTKPIPYNADDVTISSYLEALSTIRSGGVQVILYGLQACLDSGQSYFQVEFLQDFGTLPLLVPGFKNMGTSALMSVSIFQSGMEYRRVSSINIKSDLKYTLYLSSSIFFI